MTWVSQKEHIEAFSSWEARYIALTLTTCLGIWMLALVKDLTGQKLKPPKLYVD